MKKKKSYVNRWESDAFNNTNQSNQIYNDYTHNYNKGPYIRVVSLPKTCAKGILPECSLLHFFEPRLFSKVGLPTFSLEHGDLDSHGHHRSLLLLAASMAQNSFWPGNYSFQPQFSDWNWLKDSPHFSSRFWFG